MRPDAEIRHDVESELQWDPGVDDQKIGVIVHDGIVTLTGEVAHHSARRAVENIVKRVRDVRAIADEIQVMIPWSGTRNDTSIAEAAANALHRNIVTRAGEITPIVHGGWITLTGRVIWGFQKAAAENTMHCLQGVKGVRNDILVAGQPNSIPALMNSPGTVDLGSHELH
jgi:osmotically-inducible protein OsmY